MTIGQRIRAVRKALGLSQEQFGALFDYSAKQVRRYESDEISPPSDVLERIAEKTGVTMAYLSGATDDPQGTLSEKDLGSFEKLLHAARLMGEAASLLQDAINELLPAHVKD